MRVAAKKVTRALRLVEYDKKTGTIFYNDLEDDDTDVWSICLIKSINHLKCLLYHNYSVIKDWLSKIIRDYKSGEI